MRYINLRFTYLLTVQHQPVRRTGAQRTMGAIAKKR